jgi:hypothetical protein
MIIIENATTLRKGKSEQPLNPWGYKTLRLGNPQQLQNFTLPYCPVLLTKSSAAVAERGDSELKEVQKCVR